MQKYSKRLNLSRYWPFWGLHFGIHMILGFIASIGGIVIICTQNEVLSGLALIGAGSFALLNGWQGILELTNQVVNSKGKIVKRNNQ